jgi:hypothetical protein
VRLEVRRSLLRRLALEGRKRALAPLPRRRRAGRAGRLERWPHSGRRRADSLPYVGQEEKARENDAGAERARDSSFRSHTTPFLGVRQASPMFSHPRRQLSTRLPGIRLAASNQSPVSAYGASTRSRVLRGASWRGEPRRDAALPRMSLETTTSRTRTRSGPPRGRTVRGSARRLRESSARRPIRCARRVACSRLILYGRRGPPGTCTGLSTPGHGPRTSFVVSTDEFQTASGSVAKNRTTKEARAVTKRPGTRRREAR